MEYKTREQVRQEALAAQMRALKTPKNTDTTDFEAAMKQFRDVCKMIEDFSGIADFHGGFDEAMQFLASAAFAADKTQGTYLFSLWQGADKAATYEAAKCGVGQPEWWYQCWQEAAEE